MYTRCTTEKSAAQQALLEKTLLQTMAQQPYSEISVSFLCEEAGLSRKTFYRLFNNKDDVLTALIDHTLIRYMAYHPTNGMPSVLWTSCTSSSNSGGKSSRFWTRCRTITSLPCCWNAPYGTA